MGAAAARELRAGPAAPVVRREGEAMRRLLLLCLTALLAISSSGCILNIYSSDPNLRMQQMLNISEGLRQIQGEWDRFWFTDQPSHLTPIRVHGGIGP